jgi:hypothetical protein
MLCRLDLNDGTYNPTELLEVEERQTSDNIMLVVHNNYCDIASRPFSSVSFNERRIMYARLLTAVLLARTTLAFRDTYPLIGWSSHV